MVNKREYNLLKTFKPSRFWRGMPSTAEKLLDGGFIEPTKFGRGNYQLTQLGRIAIKEFEIEVGNGK